MENTYLSEAEQMAGAAQNQDWGETSIQIFVVELRYCYLLLCQSALTTRNMEQRIHLSHLPLTVNVLKTWNVTKLVTVTQGSEQETRGQRGAAQE